MVAAMLGTEMPPLSPRQEEILRFMGTFFLEHRYYPTQAEIMQAIGVKSRAAMGYVSPMILKGYLTNQDTPGVRGRTLRFTQLGLEKLERMGIVAGDQMDLFG